MVFLLGVQLHYAINPLKQICVRLGKFLSVVIEITDYDIMFIDRAHGVFLCMQTETFQFRV